MKSNKNEVTSVKEVLTAARWIVDNVGWGQYAVYKDKHNMPVYHDETSLKMDQIAKVCSLGAVYLVEASSILHDSASDLLNKTVMESSTDSLVRWNDTPGRTKEEVLALYDRTISKCE